MRGKLAVILGAVLGVAAVASVAAREEIPAETRAWPYKADLLACDAPGVIERVMSRFAQTERKFWGSDAEIVAVDKIRQAAFRPHGIDLIPRRYCAAVATMSNRRQLKLRYEIIEDAGIIGLTYGIQLCLDGYDRNHLAMPGCDRLDR